MLNISPPNFIFCPFCGNKLSTRIEEGKKRKYCQNDNWTYYPHVTASAGIVIFNGSKVFLVKRKREPYSGKWMFPAGFIDFGEYPSETAVREAAEEAGKKVSAPEFINITQIEDDPRELGHFSFFYKANFESDVDVTDKEENQDMGWFEIQNLPEIGWKSHQKIAKMIQEGKV
ncbi:hypothetical protein A2617_02825 [Candidatus Daviesbacteria bacterium RIFOXYD1_FULL_41_10]|uniref:Nudix hydrolase domain-containing protein n=1 Tax=Candidatus Daviesbacteria bacterium RIFOXYD1_FULL_41_10 TaxID=1797801 RepID=A0A1F5N3C7_9BACT|nr:MAG: hypothetical protein A2617_02825 [Candidatus Daviesbacteria bacterium RIFOXYD1_FULL_41_10]